ncbi:MAG TPA: choice-of-anchor tandem repeat GloVer-containing protein [Terriglobales bacterium]
MLRPRRLVYSATTLMLFAITVSAFGAGKETILFSFNGQDGYWPAGPLVFDTSGNLYGATPDGGSHSRGTVYKLSPASGGEWTQTVLYNFCQYKLCPDGSGPIGGPAFDMAGNLYGVTAQGGSDASCEYGCGVVYELSPGANGTWTETVLHTFGSPGDGTNPSWQSLLIDSSGNLYGTTSSGGAGACDYGCGTVFEMSPGADGQWAETILYSFRGSSADGVYPLAGLLADGDGNLYGTTSWGGKNNEKCAYPGSSLELHPPVRGASVSSQCGAVFELSPGADGAWTEKILHFFVPSEGTNPESDLVMDANGNVFGTTVIGGRQPCYSKTEGPLYCGSVFELSPNADGTWTEQTLRAFYFPRKAMGGVALDGAGNVYGSTSFGGKHICFNNQVNCGTVFELSPGQDGKWTQTTLYNFGGPGDGAFPYNRLIFDSSGNLYGVTQGGGNEKTRDCGGYGCGIVFKFTP